MQTMEKILGKLKLKINREKSAAGTVLRWKSLGYALWVATGQQVKHRVAPQALKKFKDRVRSLTSRTCGRSMEQ